MKDNLTSKEDLVKELRLLRRQLADKKGEVAKDKKKASILSETFYRAIEESPVSVIITDRDGAIEYINPKCAELTGYNLEEARGGNPRMWKSGEHPPEFYEELWDTLLQGKVWKGRLQNRKKNGELYWEEASISPVLDENGVITNFIAVKEDITARSKTEDALVSSVIRYRELFDDSPLPLWEEDFSELKVFLGELGKGGIEDFRAYFDANPGELQKCTAKIKITDVNKAAITLHKAADKEELLSNFEKIFTENSYDVFEEEIVAIAEGRQEYAAEAEVQTLCGEIRHIALQLHILRGAPGEYKALLATTDITGRKRDEEALWESKRRLDEAERIAGLGYYVFSVKSGTWTNSETLDAIFGIDEGFKRDLRGWLDIIHPDYKEEMLNYFQDNVLRQKGKFDREYKIINLRTKEEGWVHGLGTLKLDDHGEPLEMFGTIQDITAKKHAEDEAHRETEIMKNLLILSEATSSITDIDELMKRVVDITRDIITVNLVISYVWDSDKKILRPAEAAGLSRDKTPLFKSELLRLDNESVKKAMDTGRVFMELRKEGEGQLKMQQEGFCDWVDNAGLITLLPLIGKREYQGLIVCICLGNGRSLEDCTSERKTGLMQAVANQVSIALENARHYKESIGRTMELSRKVETIETISTISKAILSTLDLETVMELTSRMVSRLVSCDWLRIIEVDRVKDEFTFMAGFEKNETRECLVVPFEQTSLNTILKTRRPEYIADISRVKSPLRLERELMDDGYVSVLRIPIIAKREVIAVIGLMSRRASAFVPSDLATLEDLSNNIAVALTNARLVRDLEEFSMGTISALARSIDAKSPWTHGHSERVTHIALSIGKEAGLGEKELNDLRIAGLLHDIGKIGTYEAILDKDERLTEEEFREIKKHPGIGSDILAPIKQLSHILPAIRAHHESFDGRGYPDGLSGPEIPLHARILAVSDTVDAMGADRPYRKGKPQEVIIDELRRCSGTQFDPAVVDNYLRTIEKESLTA
ncbi:MAG: HD domain-containing phosphohydrolase [Thermodesulfobacteriota bacterium]